MCHWPGSILPGRQDERRTRPVSSLPLHRPLLHDAPRPSPIAPCPAERRPRFKPLPDPLAAFCFHITLDGQQAGRHGAAHPRRGGATPRGYPMAYFRVHSRAVSS
ncbi:hypothetical protein F751_1430 [Auxenochlorella protothecoides]|uniref:Uncharacterized protein n=1 Tax=Auxenochlorella protothecoides TaxID=3075 RepID=A0A087SJB2_AUXPR|nr:hypothetical protein F751_1430 [Auxenochlorella protothecoides]KFM25816.1 hypothetical protein F751_1430 [Auxenochlorella protothecoides]